MWLLIGRIPPVEDDSCVACLSSLPISVGSNTSTWLRLLATATYQGATSYKKGGGGGGGGGAWKLATLVGHTGPKGPLLQLSAPIPGATMSGPRRLWFRVNGSIVLLLTKYEYVLFGLVPVAPALPTRGEPGTPTQPISETQHRSWKSPYPKDPIMSTQIDGPHGGSDYLLQFVHGWPECRTRPCSNLNQYTCLAIYLTCKRPTCFRSPRQQGI